MWLPMQVNVVPYLIDNPSIGFVQARWTFTNPEESYLTKVGLPPSCRTAAAEPQLLTALTVTVLVCNAPQHADQLRPRASSSHLQRVGRDVCPYKSPWQVQPLHLPLP